MSVGQNIANARARKGMTVAEVAAITRILPGTVAAIEVDDYDELPSDVYVRGFIRSIARVLDMDVQEILLSFDREVSMPGPGESVEAFSLTLPYGGADVPAEPQQVKFGAGIAVAFLLVAMGLFFAGVGDEPAPRAEASTTDVADVQPAR